jgi:hypothetical protein
VGILERLFRRGGGDGSSPIQAVVVRSIAEEYAWMRRHCHGLQHTMQSLEDIDGKPHDVHILRDAQGEERRVYFDISRFYGKG